MIECIRSKSEKKTVIIMDQDERCGDLLDKMRDYLKSKKKTIFI
jgi:hypothetical protein